MMIQEKFLNLRKEKQMLFRIRQTNGNSSDHDIDTSVYNTEQLVKNYATSLVDIGDDLTNYVVDFLSEMTVLRPKATYGFGGCGG